MPPPPCPLHCLPHPGVATSPACAARTLALGRDQFTCHLPLPRCLLLPTFTGIALHCTPCLPAHVQAPPFATHWRATCQPVTHSWQPWACRRRDYRRAHRHFRRNTWWNACSAVADRRFGKHRRDGISHNATCSCRRGVPVPVLLTAATTQTYPCRSTRYPTRIHTALPGIPSHPHTRTRRHHTLPHLTPSHLAYTPPSPYAAAAAAARRTRQHRSTRTTTCLPSTLLRTTYRAHHTYHITTACLHLSFSWRAATRSACLLPEHLSTTPAAGVDRHAALPSRSRTLLTLNGLWHAHRLGSGVPLPRLRRGNMRATTTAHPTYHARVTARSTAPHTRHAYALRTCLLHLQRRSTRITRSATTRATRARLPNAACYLPRCLPHHTTPRPRLPLPATTSPPAPTARAILPHLTPASLAGHPWDWLRARFGCAGIIYRCSILILLTTMDTPARRALPATAEDDGLQKHRAGRPVLRDCGGRKKSFPAHYRCDGFVPAAQLLRSPALPLVFPSSLPLHASAFLPPDKTIFACDRMALLRVRYRTWPDFLAASSLPYLHTLYCARGCCLSMPATDSYAGHAFYTPYLTAAAPRDDSHQRTAHAEHARAYHGFTMAPTLTGATVTNTTSVAGATLPPRYLLAYAAHLPHAV